MQQVSKIYYKALLFTLGMAIVSSIVLLANWALLYVIGYGAVYTAFLSLFIIMYLLMKVHAVYFKREMSFISSLLFSFPVFALSTMLCFCIEDYDYDGTVIYSYYANGYFFNMLEETAKQFIPFTLFFVLIFAPIYRKVVTLMKKAV